MNKLITAIFIAFIIIGAVQAYMQTGIPSTSVKLSF
jgi:hypothetical protein